ncbi:MAG: sensor histidine kinase [Terriglobia bacterium]
MKPGARSTVALRLVVVLLAAILGLLAFLQVHWSDQVSQAERDRMTARLHTAVARFRSDFYLELLRVCWAFQIDTPKLNRKALAVYGDRYQDWQDASAHPDLVANLFIWRRNGKLLHFDPVSGQFQPAAWPARLGGVRSLLAGQDTREIASDLKWRHRWLIDENVPALCHPVGGGTGVDVPGGVIVELNAAFIQRVMLPMLAERYFRGPEGIIYRVSVVRSGNPARVIYQSLTAPPGRPAFTGDVVTDLVGNPSRRDRREPLDESSEDKSEAEIAGAVATGVPPVLPVQSRLLPRIYPAGAGGTWKLIVRHRSGSVEAAVLGLRRRNLAVSLGVLLLLGISMALIVTSAQRAQRLARLQMEFVAGVSHELRTPLAVICSAAENLADGVVGAAVQVKSYGTLIRNEGRRLTEMVEQVLAFAAQQGGRQAYNRQPLEVESAIRGVLQDLRPAIEASDAVIDLRIDPGLPPVMADPAALRTCLGNLVSNAVKYGGERPSVTIRATMQSNGRAPEV